MNLKNNCDLLRLLKKNNVSIKNYINGDKEKIIKEIKASYQKKEEDQINVYL